MISSPTTGSIRAPASLATGYRFACTVVSGGGGVANSAAGTADKITADVITT